MSEVNPVVNSKFAISLGKECLSEQILQPYVEAFTEQAHGLQIALEWERIEVEEVGVVEVPVVLSPPLQTALFTLSSRFGEACIAHLLSRPIAQLFAITMKRCIDNADAVQRTIVQLLFDCRVLHAMFLDEK
ncbi:unnamed protein product [Heligmosomoides polygyrus]|uniref:COMM domain-containing protein n=1 Tax=Heligmosomoides polygyrus TaxID=6339 RepID=A0A183G7L8_HELPZ|nr:unnamed protein product [Heligmosomoides polygyrus]